MNSACTTTFDREHRGRTGHAVALAKADRYVFAMHHDARSNQHLIRPKICVFLLKDSKIEPNSRKPPSIIKKSITTKMQNLTCSQPKENFSGPAKKFQKPLDANPNSTNPTNRIPFDFGFC